MRHHLKQLAHLSAALGDAVTVDDVARVALSDLLGLHSVIRGGLALSQGGGRELRFVSTDDDALSPLGVRWCTIEGLGEVPLARTVRTGDPVYLRSAEDLDRAFPEIARRQRRLGTQAMASVPLSTEEGCIGALLVSYDQPQELGVEQADFLGAFAAQVSQALRRALVYQVQRSTSEQLQRSLMPHSLPELPGLTLGASYRPGGDDVEVGGDWYDVMALPDGSAVVTLGDVMGKGVSAAVVMGEVRAATRAYALLDPDPTVLLGRLDRLVSSSPADQVVTMLYSVVDPARSTVTLAIAGHPPPLLVRPSGRPVVLDLEAGPALGLGLGSAVWPASVLAMEDNATLLFYSNGLVESRSRELFTGIGELRDLVEQLPTRRRDPRELCARLSEAMRSPDADDDVTLLAVTSCPSQPSASRRLPANATAAGIGRQFVTTVLRDWEVDEEVVETAEVCVSELVTNAVIHSGTESTITVRIDAEYVLVTVQDEGSSGPVRKPENVDPEAISGRGLSLVDALAAAWSAEHSTDGTTVWFELPLDPSQNQPQHPLIDDSAWHDLVS